MTLLPPGFRGAAFTLAAEGDQREDLDARARVSEVLGIPREWATLHQVHGNHVVEATTPGDLGEGDAMFTRHPMVPLAVLTADCLGVVLEADDGVGVAHAGWRGLTAGVVEALRASMEKAGIAPRRAAIGPGIGPCCYEVGDEVASQFPTTVLHRTAWGTTSLDLVRRSVEGLDGLEVWTAGRCTGHDAGFFSHRSHRSTERMAAIGWLPDV